MDKKAAVAALLPALFLYSCDRAVTPDTEATTPLPAPSTARTSAADAPPAVPIQTSGSPGGSDGAANDGHPDLAPPTLTPEVEKTEKGARNVLLSFARAIELREFDQAWALLSEGDRRKWSRPEFTKLFADLGKITVAVPTGTMEGACGSSYYTAPVTITANDRDGRPVRYEGQAVLKRVNDVDGATPAQLRWHFDRLTLDWTH